MMLNLILSIFICIIVFFVIVMIIDCHRLVVRKYKVVSGKLGVANSDGSPLRVLLLTDLHGTSFGKNNIRLINKIDSIHPDFVLIAGDLFTAIAPVECDVAFKLLEDLSKKYKIYYANGNHELKTQIRPDEFGPVYLDFVNRIKEIGINHLDNETISFDNKNIKISGLNLSFDYYKKFKKMDLSQKELDEMLGKSDETCFNILIAHNPEYFESYSEWGANLVVSGHYHGGLMRLPIIGGVISPRYKLLPHYDAGIYETGGNTMVLSCGLGTHTLPIRIFNPGELSLIEVI